MICIVSLCLALAGTTPADDAQLRQRATELAQRFLIMDGHIDVPIRMVEREEDISLRTEHGDFDYPRAREGGLDAPFLSIYTPSSYETSGGAKDFALRLIDMVHGFETAHPDKFRVVASVAEVQRVKRDGVIGLLMGMENGSPIEGDLDNVDLFHRLGVRYITLCHAEDNHLCDSSYATTRINHGLSAFGRRVVKRMNDLGVIIDIAHVSDDTFYQVLELSRAPVFASHSSVRFFTPGFERNMSDLMVRRLADHHGVIMINFGSTFLDGRLRERDDERRAEIQRYAKAHGLQRGAAELAEFVSRYDADHPRGFADVSLVADHIDHVVKLVGIDHVGLGSDFDGVGDSLPTGLKDVSMYPNLLFELLKRGYSEPDIEKVCSGNALRVLAAVEQVAAARPGR